MILLKTVLAGLSSAIQINPDFGSAISIVYNTTHWPTSGAVARKDFQALRWLGALALLEHTQKSNMLFFRFLVRGKHRLDAQFLCGDGLRSTDRGNQRKVV